LIRGDLVWRGALKANEPVSFFAEVVFIELGHQIIEATAIGTYQNAYTDVLYLDVGILWTTRGW